MNSAKQLAENRKSLLETLAQNNAVLAPSSETNYLVAQGFVSYEPVDYSDDVDQYSITETGREMLVKLQNYVYGSGQGIHPLLKV